MRSLHRYARGCLRRQTHEGDALWALGQSPPPPKKKVIAALSLSMQATHEQKFDNLH